MPKVFLVIPLTKEAKSHLYQEIKNLKEDLEGWEVNWVREENLHITLIFFGEISKDQLEKLKKEVQSTTPQTGPFKIKTGKVTVKRGPIWLEIEKGRKKIVTLQKEIKENISLQEGGQKRSFHPHLTIGRIKKRGKGKIKGQTSPLSWKADKVILYESELKKEGSVYSKIATLSLE